MECPVCYDLIQDSDSKTLDCKHQFCYKCLKQLRTRTCPLCRAPIPANDQTQNIGRRQDRNGPAEDIVLFNWDDDDVALVPVRRVRRRRRRPQTVITEPLDLTDEEIADISGESVSEGAVRNISPHNSRPDKGQQKRRRARNRWRSSLSHISNI
jgi:hypothetical protein